MKSKKLEQKTEPENPLKKKPMLKKNRSTKLSALMSSPKLSSSKLQLNLPVPKVRKDLSRAFGNSSNRSLKLSMSPKSSYVSPEEVEFPLKPSQALSIFKHELTTFEQSEIFKYSDVYYLGTLSNKIPPRLECENYGFDDIHTDYLLVKRDHIAYRYEILSLLGRGSFGQVCECFDHKKKEKVAVKVIKNKQKFHQQAKVEIRVLQSMRENDPEDKKGIIRMKNYFLFRNHVCITFELISVNLYEFLRLNHFQGISQSLIRCFAKQVLISLDYTKSLEIVHCDLKPENILLVNPQKAVIKLIDFGSSCFLNERLHTYIQSRFYRAPEIILGIPYTPAIDVWSLGCILVELFTGHPLWPGESELDQLIHIISSLGMPSQEVLAISTRKLLFFDGDTLKTNKLMSGKCVQPAERPLNDVLKAADPEFLDLILKCFEWNPSKRICPKDALAHPWVKGQKSAKTIINKKLC
jgi:dual specificity tyrosine-phosphorylation-regulated kinase 2/3/4